MTAGLLSQTGARLTNQCDSHISACPRLGLMLNAECQEVPTHKQTHTHCCRGETYSLTLSVYGSESVSINYIPQIRPWQLCALGASVVVLVCALRCYCCQNNANVRYQLVLPSEKKCGIKWTKRKSKGGRKDRKRNVRSGWNSQVIRMKWKEWK